MHLITELQNTWSKTEKKWEIDNSIIIIGNFDIPLLIMVGTWQLREQKAWEHYKPTRPNWQLEHSTE